MPKLYVFRHGEAKARLSEVISRANAGEVVVIARGDLPMVRVERIGPHEMSACQMALAKAQRTRSPIAVEVAGNQVAVYSEESERAVLATVLLLPCVLPLISGRLCADDFYLERHQTLYQAMLDLLETDRPIDVKGLQETLSERGFFDGLGATACLDRLRLERPDPTRLDTHVELVKERAIRRKLIELCGALAGQGSPATEATT